MDVANAFNHLQATFLIRNMKSDFYAFYFQSYVKEIF